MTMGRLSDLVTAARQRPRLVDAVIAVLFGLLSASGTVDQRGGDAVTAVEWLWICLLMIPLIWRRQHPVRVFWIVYALALVGFVVDVAGPYSMIFPVVTITAIARYRPRRYLWPAIAAIEVPLAVGWLVAGGQWYDVAILTGVLVIALLVGINLQTRNALLAELRDRAARLERDQDQQAQLAVAAERARIAREMHDIVAHNLAVMVALADGAAVTTPVAPERAADMMEKVSATGREALGEIRKLVGLLKEGEQELPAVPVPGFADIDALVEQVRAAGLNVTLTHEGVPGPWGPGAGLTVYRIVQEALTNTMKHAGRRAHAEVNLRYTPTRVDIEITDDGAQQTFEVPAAAEGHGLAGMTERVSPYAGTVVAGPRPGSGWRVHAHLSFDEAREHTRARERSEARDSSGVL